MDHADLHTVELTKLRRLIVRLEEARAGLRETIDYIDEEKVWTKSGATRDLFQDDIDKLVKFFWSRRRQ